MNSSPDRALNRNTAIIVQIPPLAFFRVTTKDSSKIRWTCLPQQRDLAQHHDRIQPWNSALEFRFSEPNPKINFPIYWAFQPLPQDIVVSPPPSTSVLCTAYPRENRRLQAGRNVNDPAVAHVFFRCFCTSNHNN